MTRNMNNFDGLYNSYDIDPLFKYEMDYEFSEWCSMEGSERISELSRQLRSYLNYKNAIIRYRYLGSQKQGNILKEDSMIKWEGELFSEYSRYTTLLKRIAIDEATIAKKIQNLIEKVKIQPDNLEINLLKEIKHIGRKLWKNLHFLSELELHHHPRLLYMAIKIACILCSVEGVFFSLSSNFYGELKHSYLQLEKELSGLFSLNGEDQLEKMKKKRRVRILE